MRGEAEGAEPEVVLYGKPDCPLCEEGRDALETLRGSMPFRLREVDITGDDELHRRYLERVPVVAVEGEPVCDLIVDAGAVTAALRRAARTPR